MAKKAASVSLGKAVPDFTVKATHGSFRLKEQRGRTVVLYFYPKDSTPGCTTEGHDFTRLKKDFAKAGADVYGLSRDSLKSHEKFKTNECFEVELLSDPDEEVCGIFDVVKEKNMYGKKVWGIERSTFVISPEGKLVAEWRKVKVPGHAEEVLAKVRELNSK